MATTIKLKNGSGAPLAGNLVQGEPALDLTNKRLYTEDSGGTVIEVGTNPTSLTTGTFTSTGIDDNATSTAITIDASENVGIGTTSPTHDLTVGSTTASDYVIALRGGVGGFFGWDDSANTTILQAPNTRSLSFRVNSDTFSAGTEAMRINSSGNVGIGTASPNGKLDITGSGNTDIYLNTGNNSGDNNRLFFGDTADIDVGYLSYDHGTNAMSFGVNATERMRIDSSGSVHIGASANDSQGYTLDLSPDVQKTAGIDVNITSPNVNLDLYAGGSPSNLGGWSGQIRFMTGGSNTLGTERMRIDSSGNVGIGTSSPSSYGFFAVDRGAPASADSTIASFMAQSTRRMGLVWDDSQSTLGLANLTSQDLCFHIGGIGGANERMRIKSTGNVGIGTDSPDSLLHIEGNDTEAKLTLGRSGTNTTGDILGALQFKNEDGSDDGPNIVANIQAVAQNANGSGGYLTFGTHDGTEGGEGSSPVESMRLDATGNLLVGTTSTTQDTSNFGTRIGGTAVPGYLASYRNVSGAGVAVLFGGNEGEVYIRGDGDLENTNNSYGAISDERLKSNIVDASSQIDDIMAVQVRSYTLNKTGDTHIGVVAQELEASGMSGLVKTDDEGMKSVKYSLLYLKAIKALQEAITRIETLEAEVAALKGA